VKKKEKDLIELFTNHKTQKIDCGRTYLHMEINNVSLNFSINNIIIEYHDTNLKNINIGDLEPKQKEPFRVEMLVLFKELNFLKISSSEEVLKIELSDKTLYYPVKRMQIKK